MEINMMQFYHAILKLKSKIHRVAW